VSMRWPSDPASLRAAGPLPAWPDAEQTLRLREGEPPAALGAREEPQETRIPRQEEPLEVVVVLEGNQRRTRMSVLGENHRLAPTAFDVLTQRGLGLGDVRDLHNWYVLVSDARALAALHSDRSDQPVVPSTRV